MGPQTPAVPPAGAAPQGGEHLPRPGAPMARLRGGGPGRGGGPRDRSSRRTHHRLGPRDLPGQRRPGGGGLGRRLAAGRLGGRHHLPEPGRPDRRGALRRRRPAHKEVGLVASDPLVLSAGGTTLDASHATGAWIGETAWGLPDGSPGSAFQASGGGFSHLFRRPSYQNGVQGISSMRGIPDVAADGDPVTGIAVITGSAGGGYTIRPSTTSPPAKATQPSSPRRRSPATGQVRAGTRSPAGAAPTPRC
jgi:hypothetical protein